MAKTVDKINGINQTAAQLAALVCGEKVYTPDNAPAGYASVDAIATASGEPSRVCVMRKLQALHRTGQLRRIAVAREGARREYWYGL